MGRTVDNAETVEAAGRELRADDWAAPLAAIDLGSNSFRLEIGVVHQGSYRRVDYLKETVRLGGGLDADSNLTEEAIERGLTCLRRFAARISGFAPGQVRAVATQTLREARNRNLFLLRAEAALGFAIEVISGREEARLTYAGVMHLQPTEHARLVVDIGGRSTELILGVGATPTLAESFAVGSVGLSQRFFGDGRLTAAAFRAAQIAAGAEFEEALSAFRRPLWREALGSSGTAGAVAQLLAANQRSEGGITPEGLRWCIERCIEAGSVERLDLVGLKSDRKPVLAGGLAILYTLAAQFGIELLQPAKGALRQGVIVDLHQRRLAARLARFGAGADLRDHSVLSLQRRFEVDRPQAERVAGLALALYDQAQPASELETRRELSWACALHELGLVVSHHDHHRHSAYLMANVDAPGFSQSQQRRIGELVLGQRGGLRKLDAALQNPGFAWQVLCLRLAVIGCHARDAVEPADWSLHRRSGREGRDGRDLRDLREARLGFAAGWGEGRERTRYLLQEEALAWQRQGPLRLVMPD